MNYQDTIEIKDLSINAFIGVYDFEKGHTQKLLISLTLFLDLSIPATSDMLSDTLDYDNIVTLIKNEAKRTHIELIETLALNLLKKLFQTISCNKIKLTVNKPQAIPDAISTSVTLIRKKEDLQ
jgi:7,8-dihydroneopterin aldolase/epimerase/oxygenase